MHAPYLDSCGVPMLYKELGIASVPDLEDAARRVRLAERRQLRNERRN